MKVKLLCSRAGQDPNSHAYFAQSFGDVIEVPAAEGKRMIEAGQAEDPKTKRETAMLAGKR